MTLDENVFSTAILKRADGGELPAHSFPAAGGEPCILKGGLVSAASTGRASAAPRGQSKHPGSYTGAMQTVPFLVLYTEGHRLCD